MNKNIKVLIIDDDLTSRKILSNCIRQNFPEFQLENASYAIEGLKKVKEFCPDIVFLDIEMPYGDGFEMLETIIERKFEVIFVSGHTSYKSKIDEYDAIGYLTKPICKQELYSSIKKALHVIKKRKIIVKSKMTINCLDKDVYS